MQHSKLSSIGFTTRVIPADTARRKLVAFAGLTIPYTLTTEQMDLEKDAEENPPPQGHNSSLAVEFFEILEVSKKYGYDPKKDYRK